MPSVALAHATGFCGGVWRPVVKRLEDQGFATLAWDFPCHGAAPRLEHPIDWWDFGRYALSRLPSLTRPVVGVGHSMGGAALILAELLSPGSFSALLLIEPIVFPPPYGRSEYPLVAAAEKRKSSFESRRAARVNFADKPSFVGWDPEALDGYLECGLVDSEHGVSLACRPEDEAEIYRTATVHGAWDRLVEVEPPVLVMAGAASDTHPPEWVRAFCERLPSAGFEIVEGTGHFLPMEMPDLIVRRIGRIATVL